MPQLTSEQARSHNTPTRLLIRDQQAEDFSSATYHENLALMVTNKAPTIKMTGISKRFKKTVAVDNVTVNIYEGQIFWYLLPALHASERRLAKHLTARPLRHLTSHHHAQPLSLGSCLHAAF